MCFTPSCPAGNSVGEQAAVCYTRHLYPSCGTGIENRCADLFSPTVLRARERTTRPLVRMEIVSSSTPDPARMRVDYASTELTEDLLAPDWPTQFGRWLAEAVAAGVAEPNAMVLATA